MSKITRIYIPGLGDEATLQKQRKIISKWNNTSLFEPNWHSKESLADKLSRLQQLLDDTPDVTEVVGSSAGGGLALAFFGQNSDKIRHLILISSKFRKPELIGHSYQKRAPALLQAVNASAQALKTLTPEDRAKITTYRPLFDNVIPTSTMTIEGATNKRVFAVGHAIGIGAVLLRLMKK